MLSHISGKLSAGGLLHRVADQNHNYFEFVQFVQLIIDNTPKSSYHYDVHLNDFSKKI